MVPNWEKNDRIGSSSNPHGSLDTYTTPGMDLPDGVWKNRRDITSHSYVPFMLQQI